MTDQELSSFLRLLAHDLQNQIGAVDLNLQIMPTLADDTDPTLKTLSPFIERASASATEMIETLTDVQSFAYSLAGEHDHQVSSLDLSTLAKDCVLILASKAEAREVQLTVGDLQPAPLKAERESVLRALRLLISEALRSSFPGSSLMLSSAVSQNSGSSITIHSNQEGLFEANRPTLAFFLAQTAIKSSGAQFQFFTGSSRSALRLAFPAQL